MNTLFDEPAGTDERPVTTGQQHYPDGGCPDGHEWVVFSTALKDICLMVQCVNCGAFGTVDDPSKLEWSEAYDAPSRPYRWGDESRVNVRGRGPLYVLKADEGQGDETPSTKPEGVVD